MNLRKVFYYDLVIGKTYKSGINNLTVLRIHPTKITFLIKGYECDWTINSAVYFNETIKFGR